MAKQRIEYFDTTKGLLMFFLIWGHMIIFAKTLGIESDFTQTIQNMVPFYRVFFMQTFFFITGFCTSWGIPFKEFLVKNFKTILLPAFIFFPVAYATQLVIGKECGEELLSTLVLRYLTEGVPWFLAALFISKVLYWLLNQYCKNAWLKLSCVAVLFLFGLAIKEFNLAPNNWSYQQALIMLPFLYLGNVTKLLNQNGLQLGEIAIGGGKLLSIKWLIIFSIPYFGIIALWQILGLGLGFPAVDAYLDIHFITAPFHLVFAISGTALIFLIAQKLQRVEFIKVIGKQSLFVYLVHTFAVFSILKLWQMSGYDMSSYAHGAIFYIATYIISFFILYLGCRLMENKYFSWMVGKF